MTSTMLTPGAADRPASETKNTARRSRPTRIALGSLELLAVAGLSMFLVDGVLSTVLPALGAAGVLTTPAGIAAVMATDVALGTSLWMLFRRRTTRAILVMIMATAAGLALPLLPWAAGLITAMEAVLAGHLLLVPALIASVALFPDELGPTVDAAAITVRHPGPVRRPLNRLAHRWPTVLALLLTVDNLLEPSVLPAPILILLGAEYLVIGGLRRQFADRLLLAAHLIGAAAYLLLGIAAVLADPVAATWLIGLGWILHATWDVLLHRANRVVWRWYAETCAVFDVVIGSTVLVTLTL